MAANFVKITAMVSLFFVLSSFYTEVAGPADAGEIPEGTWTVYEANELPNAFTSPFNASQQAGTFLNEIISDNGQPGNNLLHMHTASTTDNDQWRQAVTAGLQNMTVVIRAKGIDANANLVFDVDLDHGANRWSMRVLTSGNYQVAVPSGGATAALGVNTMDWNIYRFTKSGSNVAVYVNESTTPIYTGVASAGANSYFRFGDGWGSGRVDSHVDWVVWDVTGAYSPEQTSLPASLLSGGETPAAQIDVSTQSLGTFAQVIGTPSDVQTYSVSASNLADNLTITPPAPYEVSADNGVTWFTGAAPLVLVPQASAITPTTIQVRLNASSAGTYPGNIAHATSGATSVNVAVTGLGSTTPEEEKQLAFPGAEGGGRYAAGGRGGAVYEVTNLNDSGAGSFRDAVSQPNRTVVFRVSGVINLGSPLTISKNNITVAGQTAPGDGICLTGYTFRVRASDVIVRYIRSRLTDVKNVEDDAMNSFSGAFANIIIDHCSISWSVDETGTFYDIKNFTLQWCLLSESLYNSVHGKGAHGYGGIWGGNNASFHHNLLAHHTSRNPRFCGSRFTGKPEEEVVDFRNNVIYNWGNGNSAYGGEGGHYNMVNNYYKPGPATPGNLTTSSATNKRNRILQYTSYYFATDAAVYPDTLFGGQFYVDGNFVYGYPDVSADNWAKGVQTDAYKRAAQLKASAKQNLPFSTPPVTTQSAEQAYLSVLAGAGATLPKRDAIDQRIVGEVQNGTATFAGPTYSSGVSNPSGIIDTQTDVGGMPAYQSTTAPADSDHDGMPDSWETQHGLNPGDNSDRNTIAGDGYTNLEVYLNSIAAVDDPTATIIVNAALQPFTQQAGTPSVSQSYTVSGSGLTAGIQITPPANFEVSPDNGATWHTHATPLVLAASGGVVSSTAILVRMNGSQSGIYSGEITHSSTAATPVATAVTGSINDATQVPPGTALVVARDGSGNYTTVQAAINAAPAGRTSPYIIFIRNGIYKEKINIPSSKPFIQLVGESVANTILTYDDYSGKAMPGGGTYGTSNSASVTINAANFTAVNLSFENSTGDAPQALAVNVNADRAAFKGCRFLGGQDTILTNGSSNHQYFKDCYIDGVVDFIFGNALAVFDSCIVYAKSRADGLSGSYITAANTPSGNPYGYVFRNCILPANTGVTKYVLGRPWQNSTGANPVSFPKVVLINATLGHAQIKPEGWSVWDAGTITSSIYYAEYKSRKFDGSPVNISKRVPWSFQLTDAEAAAYTNETLFGSWDVCAVAPDFCQAAQEPIAVSNFKGKKGNTTSAFGWNISWPIAGVKYELFRSSDNASFAKVYEHTAANDTTVNFAYSEGIPAAGSSYFYYLVASKSGMQSHITPVIEISSTPTITVTGNLSNFRQGLGLPSAVQRYTVSGANLLGNISIIPPADFEISADGATWHTKNSPLVLTPSENTLSTTALSVRLNSGATGTLSGVISHGSAGATSIDLPVQGTVQAEPLPVSNKLIRWPLTAGDADKADERAAGIDGNVSAFKNFYGSNGTTVANVPAYSETFGQAFSAVADGSGMWTSAAGGPGGNLNRKFYKQFTVTASGDYSVRVDSVVLASSFYGTSSNTRLAVVYSKTGFLSDSTDVTGGVGADGTALLSASNGAFATPVALANETSGTALRYRFAFNGSEGITLQPGKSITIRLYFSCGSTSSGRYAKLKNVYVKGFATQLLPAIEVNGALSAFSQNVGTPSEAQAYSVSGANLKGAVAVTAPAGFELSSDNGLSWKGSTSSIDLMPASGMLAATQVQVRMNAGVAGEVSGTITHASTGALPMTLSVSGTATTVTGIGKQVEQQLSVSPNPASTWLTIGHPVMKKGSDVYTAITVLGITGVSMNIRLVETSHSATVIDVGAYPSGIYCVEYRLGSERLTVRFVKR